MEALKKNEPLRNAHLVKFQISNSKSQTRTKIQVPNGFCFRLELGVWNLEFSGLRPDLVAVARECANDHLRVRLVEHRGAAQVTLRLLIAARRQVASASLTVLHFAFGRDAEALLRTFVGFLLGHLKNSADGLPNIACRQGSAIEGRWKPRIVRAFWRRAKARSNDFFALA